jgi:hypothetical protein
MIDRRSLLSAALLASGISISKRFCPKFIALHLLKLNEDLARVGMTWRLFESGGEILFRLYSADGGLTNSHLCYLVTEYGGKHYAIGIKFTSLECMAVNDDPEAVERIVNFKLTEALGKAQSVEFDPDGGKMPMPA